MMKKEVTALLSVYMTVLEEETHRERFEHIYHSYHRQMLAVALGILRDEHQAEDAVHEALLRISRNMSSLPRHSDTALRTYVLVAAKNAALDMLPKQKRWAEMEDISQFPLSDRRCTFQKVAQRQDYDRLLTVIRQLPERYREVLYLIYVCEHSVAQAAKVLGRKQGTVRKQLQRGREILIAICKQEGIYYE